MPPKFAKINHPHLGNTPFLVHFHNIPNLYFRVVLFRQTSNPLPAAFIEVRCILKLGEGSSIDTNHTCNKNGESWSQGTQWLKSLTSHSLWRSNPRKLFNIYKIRI